MKNNTELEFIKNNYKWIISFLPTGVVAISAILKFIEYVTALSYFNYYGIDINLYNYGDIGFTYSLIISIIFLLAICSKFFYIEQIHINLNNKKKLKTILYFVLIIFLNIYLSSISLTRLYIQNFYLSFIFITVLDLVSYLIILKKLKKNNFDIKNTIITFCKIIPILIIIFIVFIFGKTLWQLKHAKKYNVIEDNKVIVYSSKDYYLVLNCKIEDNNLIIYKGEQTKIDNTNVESKNKEFKNVEIK